MPGPFSGGKRVLTPFSRRALARALSIAENGDKAGALPDAGYVVGVTGAPGSGKSTLVSALVRELRARGSTVAVLAIDPTSPRSGGALLGDRARMGEHQDDDGVFIRSAAARGHLGGLAASTRAMLGVLRGAGFDVVIVETVGIGQSEVEVASLADCTLVLWPPDAGDELQAMKAGVLEVADLIVLNKADLPAAPGAEAALRVRSVPVVRTVATTGEGVAALLDAVQHLELRRRQERAADDPRERA